MHNYNFFSVLCGCETWSSLREACKPSILENRVLSELFGTTENGENYVN